MGETFIQSGLYAYVRQPEFFGVLRPYADNNIVGLHGATSHQHSHGIGVTLYYASKIVEEEKRNVKKFGDAYKDYMRRAPRINLLAGIIKSMRERKSE